MRYQITQEFEYSAGARDYCCCQQRQYQDQLSPTNYLWVVDTISLSWEGLDIHAFPPVPFLCSDQQVTKAKLSEKSLKDPA